MSGCVRSPPKISVTVLATARARGHIAIGIDIDPLAVLIAKIWTTTINKSEVRIAAKKVLARAERNFESLPLRGAYPDNADEETRAFIRYWFDPCARRQLASLALAIRRCRSPQLKEVLWCAFSRLIIAKQAGVSLALDLAHSRPHKHFEKAPIRPFGHFLKAIEKVLENCLSEADQSRGPRPSVQLGDARRLKLRDKTIDLVLTSPPYLNAIDYFRCSKFSLVWMGRSTSDIRSLRSSSVGSEVGKYGNAKDESSEALISRLNLRSRLSRRKQALLARFIDDMEGAIREVARVLVPGGKAVYVIGENTVKGTYIQNAKIIVALAKKAGLKLRSQNSRVLPPSRRYLPPPSGRKGRAALDARMRREVVLKFVKPKAS